MKNFLIRHKIIDNFVIELPISRENFVWKLGQITEKGSHGIFHRAVELFSGNHFEFKGKVDYDSFEIRRKRKFFDFNQNFCTAKGSFMENNGILTVDTTISGYNNIIGIMFIFLLVFYMIGIIMALATIKSKESLIALPFILLHAFIFLGALFLVLKRSVKRMKRDLEREFFFLTK